MPRVFADTSVLFQLSLTDLLLALADDYTYDVIRAVEIPMATVQTLARETSWVKGHRLSVGQIARPVEGSRDVTDLIRQALNDLGN
jgi:hypothetical protein